MMDRRMCVLIYLFAAAAIALPQCAARQGAQPPAPARVEPAKVVGADAHETAHYTPVGSVYRVNAGSREVLVRTKRILKMGERLYVEVDSAKAMMTATFPMLTSSKCTLEAGSRKYFGRLSKGMPVYLYVPGERKKARSEPTFVETHKAGDTKTVGGMEFVYIPAGSFMMGSSEKSGEFLRMIDRKYGNVSWDHDEQPRHHVTVDGFWMGCYEVTQAQYEAVMGNNPSNFKGWFTRNRPVERVSWHDAKDFCRKFSEKHAVLVRLPTEAEWEYACRAGSTTAYYWGGSINGSYLWYDANSGSTTHPVGQKQPNAWGLYDMSGNVWEWCEDWYDGSYYARSPERNPKGPESGVARVSRGGGWYNTDTFSDGQLRSASRNGNPSRIGSSDGFRVVVPSAGK